MRKTWIASIALQAAFGASIALAENAPNTQDDGDWDVSVGGGVVVGPVSPGIDAYQASPVPGFEIVYQDRVFLSARQGLGFYFFNGNNSLDLTAGAAIGYDFGRDEEDAETELDGLGDIDGSAELKLFAEKKFGPFAIGGELAQGLSDDGHNGLRGEVDASFNTRLAETTFVSVGPFVTFGDEEYLQSYYGVTAAQAARSTRFTQNEQEAGFESVGLKTSVRYGFADNWSLMGSAQYQHLIGDVADSPIVENEGNVSGSLFLIYTFD